MIGIMRHGKTDWNIVHKIQGRTDIPLNDEGINSAREARDKVLACNFDICYVSPLIRARQTAQIVTEGSGIECVVDDRLKELGFGDYEGMEGVYGKPDHPLYKFFFDTEHYEATGGAESIECLMKRVESFCDDVLNELMEEGKNVLIVAHGALNAALITFLMKNPIKDFWAYGQSNCSIFKYYPEDLQRTKSENFATYIRKKEA